MSLVNEHYSYWAANAARAVFPDPELPEIKMHSLPSFIFLDLLTNIFNEFNALLYLSPEIKNFDGFKLSRYFSS